MARMSPLSLLSFASAAVAVNPPLVLVPGLTGSALEVREKEAHMPHIFCKGDTQGGWMKVWVEPRQVLPKEIDCLTARLTLTYDAANDSYSNLPGVELRALGFGNGTADGKSSKDILYKYEFGPMIDHLSAVLGYELGRDLFIAPYDWRLAGDAHAHASNGVGGFYSQLKELLETSVSSSGLKAVVLSHSLGCPTTLYFFHKYVSEAWREEHIADWLALSGPWMGGATQVSAYLGGWTLGMPSWLVPHDYVKKVQVNASSGVWLTPHPKAFGDKIVASTPSRNYTAEDIPELISRVGLQAGGQQTVSLFQKLRDPFTEIQRPPVKVRMHNWYSYGKPTAETYIYGSDITEGFNEAPKQTILGEGDGIVNLVSLKQVEQAWPTGPESNVQTEVFPNCSHFGMLSDERVLAALTDLLKPERAEVIV
mmetsp:Transcript_54691/g.97575  ORF Transcript_54691/g.97575 Transcript_54691/m.97575 type:complete len:424 (+) Transcript_54691:47-1318(+)